MPSNLSLIKNLVFTAIFMRVKNIFAKLHDYPVIEVSMNRKFVINLIFAIGINLLIKPFWVLGVERGVQNALGAEAYGFYFSLASFSFIFNVILDFGINNYNNTFIAKYPHLLQKKFPQLVMLKLLLVLVYVVITFSVAFFIGYDTLQVQLLLILCLNQILSFVITFLRSNISGLQFFFTDSILSVVDRLLMIVFCALMLWGRVFGPFKLEWFVYAQTLSYCITALIAYLVLRPHLHQLHWKWSSPFMLHLLRKSYPYALLGILMGCYSKIDGVLLERLLPLGKTQAGHYASAYRLLDAANMIAVLFAALLLPFFARLLRAKESPNSLLELSFTLIIIPAIVAASLCFFYSDSIILLLNKVHNTETEKTLTLLMLSFVFTCVVYVYGTFLTAANELRLLNKIALLGVLINLTLNLLFIKSYGIVGAAWSALITQSFVALLHYYFTHQKYRIPFNTKLMIKVLLFCILQFAIPSLLANFELNLFIKIGIQILLVILFLMYFNIFQIAQLKRLVLKS